MEYELLHIEVGGGGCFRCGGGTGVSSRGRRGMFSEVVCVCALRGGGTM